MMLGLLAPLAAQAAYGAKRPKTVSDPNRPNVIVILADDLGYGDLGCYGAKNVETPNVDSLASRGVRFTDTHAIAATSTPSRYSLLTGEYAWRKPGTDVAAGNAGMIIRPEQYTMADMFRSRGYRTCAIGKWHLGLGDRTGEQDWNAPLPASLADLGFDYHYIMAATADRVPCVFIENGSVANWDASAPIEVSYKQNFPGEPTGKQNPELCYNMQSSHGHNQSIVNGIGRIGYAKGGGKALWKDENIADSITSHAISFIKANHDKPFFMYFATNDVHVPRFPHERFRGKSGWDSVVTPSYSSTGLWVRLWLRSTVSALLTTPSSSSRATMVPLWTTAIRTVLRNSLTVTSLPDRGVAISIAPSKEVRLFRRLSAGRQR